MMSVYTSSFNMGLMGKVCDLTGTGHPACPTPPQKASINCELEPKLRDRPDLKLKHVGIVQSPSPHWCSSVSYTHQY